MKCEWHMAGMEEEEKCILDGLGVRSESVDASWKAYII